MNDKTFDYRIKVDANGNIIVNLYDYICNEMTDEQKKEFLENGGWTCFIQKAMAEDVVHSFAREHYNSLYHILRTLILNSEAMPELVKSWAEAMINARETSKVREEYWQLAYQNLKNWIRDTYGLDDYFKSPDLPTHKYDLQIPQWMIDEAGIKAGEFGVMFPEPTESKE